MNRVRLRRLLLLKELLQGDLVDLHVFLDHHSLKRLEVVDVEYLLHDAVVRRVVRA